MAETWKPIPGWEGYYEVSEAGLIRSVDRKIVTKAGWEQLRRGQTLSRHANDAGYLYSMASMESVQKRIWVHRAVLEAFGSPRPTGKVCMHIDNDPTNNRAENLKWGTQKENIQQCVREGRQHNMNKTHCKRGHSLGEGNLAPSILAAGRRACLACYEATRKYPLKECGEAVVKDASDKNYALISAL